MSIAFKPEALKEARKEFRGVITASEYGEEPFGIKGAPYIKPQKKLAVQIETDEYEKAQLEWYVPSDKLKTKWAAFIMALKNSGIMKDLPEPTGLTDDEKVANFAKSLIGVEADWAEIPVEVMGRPSEEEKKAGKGRHVDCILPTAYYGKKAVGGEIKTAAVGLG